MKRQVVHGFWGKRIPLWAGKWPLELDLQVSAGLTNAYAVVLDEAFEQLDPLLQQEIPRTVAGIVEIAVLVRTPFPEQDGAGIFAPEQGG